MLPEGWSEMTLGDVIRLEYGASLPAHSRRSGSIPVYGSSGITGYHDEPLVEGPVVVIGRKGSAGNVFWSSVDCYPIDTTYWAKCSPAVDPRFGFYLLAAARLPDLASGTGVPGLDRRRVTALSVALPSLDEQRQIVAVLEQADRAVETAARHVANAQALSRAAIEAEVTPSRERSNRAASPLEDVATWEKGRTVSLEPFSGSRPYLTAAVCRGGEAKESAVTGSGVEATSGDPLVLWDGASAGAVFIAPVDGVVASTMSVVRPTSAEVSKEWLGLVLTCRAHLLSDTTSGTTVPHVSGRVLAQISVPIPPLAEQQAIVARIEKVETAVRAAQAHLERLRALRSSLLENLVSGRVRLPMPDATASEVTA